MAVSGTLRNVRIAGVACAVPETVVDNDAFVERFGAEQMQKFEKMVGVKERRFSTPEQTSSDFACAAAKQLLRSGLWKSDDVDCVIFVSQTPDYALPATACVLQHRLGIKKDCIAFDVNLGCSGFVYGFFIASSVMQMEGVNKVLFLGGDCISKTTSPLDSSAAPLFGDGGFACVLAKDAAATPFDYSYRTDGSGYRAIVQSGITFAGRKPVVRDADLHSVAQLLKRGDGMRAPSELQMDGMDVFNFTINEVPDLIKGQMAKSGVTPDDVDLMVLHQANRFVLKQVSMMTGFSMKKVPISMDRYGNTSVTSIPLTLCDYAKANPNAGRRKLLMSGFGVGLSWGTLLGDFDFDVCQGIKTGSERFEEGAA